MASPCLGKAAPHCGGLRRTQLLLFHPAGREAATEAAETQLPEQEGAGLEQYHRSPIHGPVQGQGPDLSSELGWGAAASQCCVHSGKQLQVSFLTCCVVWEESFLLYSRGTLA